MIERVTVQKIAELPLHRLSDSPPLTYCEVDMFGPFLIKQCRNEVKHGAMFTCMGSRAVHIEITHHLDTDSFFQPSGKSLLRGEISKLFSHIMAAILLAMKMN